MSDDSNRQLRRELDALRSCVDDLEEEIDALRDHLNKVIAYINGDDQAEEPS